VAQLYAFSAVQTLKVNVERVKHPGMWPTCYMLFALLIQAIPGRVLQVSTFANYTDKP